MAMVPGFAIQADTASMEGHAPDGRTYSDDGILLDSFVSNVLRFFMVLVDGRGSSNIDRQFDRCGLLLPP